MVKIRTGDLVAVLDGHKAIILRNDGDAVYPNLIVVEAREQELPPDRALHDDRPGRVYQSSSQARSAVEVADRHEAAERAFIASVAERLERLIAADAHSAIVIVAPPRELGAIRAVLSAAARTALRGEIAHDWVHLPVYEIEKRLKRA
jgi:protein required for attachment to host cells